MEKKKNPAPNKVKVTTSDIQLKYTRPTKKAGKYTPKLRKTKSYVMTPRKDRCQNYQIKPLKFESNLIAYVQQLSRGMKTKMKPQIETLRRKIKICEIKTILDGMRVDQTW